MILNIIFSNEWLGSLKCMDTGVSNVFSCFSIESQPQNAELSIFE